MNKILTEAMPQSFIMHTQMKGMFEALTPDEAYELMMAIFDYHLGIEFVIKHKCVEVALSQLKPQFDRNAEAYRATCIKREQWKVKSRKNSVKPIKNDEQW